jgi:hypothetical protein
MEGMGGLVCMKERDFEEENLSIPLSHGKLKNYEVCSEKLAKTQEANPEFLEERILLP